MATLLLQDGTRFTGEWFGAATAATGEVVFATDMLGYQQLLTDPAYAGRILCLTYPLIGNVGVSEGDMASPRAWAAGLVVQGLCDLPSNWRCQGTLPDFLRKQGVPALTGVDTRALARHVRAHGVQRGCLCQGEPTQADLDALQGRAPETDWVSAVTCVQPYTLPGDGPRVAVLDLGVDRSALAALTARGCRVTVYPAGTPADTLTADCDGVLLSGGPGSPLTQTRLLDTVRTAMAQRPVLGVGLGYELMILAQGGGVTRMAYGHHGGQPVKEAATGWCDQSAQRHLYAADPAALPAGAAVAFTNANDGTIAGLSFAGGHLGVQFHPSAIHSPRAAHHTGRVWDAFIARLGQQ